MKIETILLAAFAAVFVVVSSAIADDESTYTTRRSIDVATTAFLELTISERKALIKAHETTSTRVVATTPSEILDYLRKRTDARSIRALKKLAELPELLSTTVIIETDVGDSQQNALDRFTVVEAVNILLPCASNYPYCGPSDSCPDGWDCRGRNLIIAAWCGCGLWI